MSLTGKLVEIFELRDVLQPTPRMLELNPRMQRLQVNGEKGWALEWVAEELRYAVETFNGDFVCIPEANLREYVPPGVADGGFDVAWPATGLEYEFETFAAKAAQALMERSFCLVQMTNVRQQAALSISEALMREEWTRILPEFEPSFLGTGSLGKISWLERKEDTSDNPESESVLDSVDIALTSVAGMLAPYYQYLGFSPGSRSAAMLRMPFEDEGEEEALMRGADPNDRIAGREIEGCLQFTSLSKIGFMYFLHGSGGKVTLQVSGETVEVIPEEGQLLLFRQDHLSLSYVPKNSKQLVMQAWMFREQRPGEAKMPAVEYTSTLMESVDKSLIPKTPSYGNQKETVDIMSLGVRCAGSNYSADDFWQVLTGGCDGLQECGSYRWDHSMYFDPSSGHPNPLYGQQNYRHFGFIDDVAYMYFDNEFFGMPEEFAFTMTPAGRLALESAYECLQRSGWDLKNLQGTEIGFAMGIGPSDYLRDYLEGNVPAAGPVTGSAKFRSTSCAYEPELIPYTMGFRGPAIVIETACSSSLCGMGSLHCHMRPRMPGQIRGNNVRQLKAGLSMGQNSVFSPFTSAGLAAGGMLTVTGRCYTFNSSADGYVRGEGNCAVHLQVHDKESFSRMAILASSALNQDGKSASMTAPNGPSQTQVTKKSMEEAGITALDIQVQELHGTGTPLGDPIEVGALRAAMMKHDVTKEVRSLPLINTSAKSNVGHGEANAGLAGFIKVTLMLMFSGASPGNHIAVLNQNMDVAAYPVYFNDEFMDTNKTSDNCGVSSFGFSGCNARTDVWGMATAGPRKTVPIGREFSSARHEMFGVTAYEWAGQGGQLMDSKFNFRTQMADGFEGVYSSGLLKEDSELTLAGTWSLWATMDPMESVPELSAGESILYQGFFRMGETLIEEFCIHVDGFVDNILYPSYPSADQDAIVLGPGTAPKGYYWRVDGRKDGAKAGTVYAVSLEWFPARQQKFVKWEIIKEEPSATLRDFTHRYSVKSSWTSWMPQEMRKTSNALFLEYATKFKIGLSGEEEFHFVRDADDSQMLYPAVSTMSNESVAIKGPDAFGKKRLWSIKGSTGEEVTLSLTIADGSYKLSVNSDRGTARTWQSLPASNAGRYYLADVDGRCKQMKSTGDHVHKIMIQVLGSEGEDFQIQLDQDPDQAVYPELNGASNIGLSSATGPDRFGHDYFWHIDAEEDSKIEVTLDTSKADRRLMVSWTDATSRTLEDAKPAKPAHTPIGLATDDD